jgi:hypothetical protein
MADSNGHMKEEIKIRSQLKVASDLFSGLYLLRKLRDLFIKLTKNSFISVKILINPDQTSIVIHFHRHELYEYNMKF